MSSTKLIWVLAAAAVGVPTVRSVIHAGRRKTTVTIGQTYCAGQTPCVLTYHNDNNRDGVNPNEQTFLASQGINPVVTQSVVVDGQIYAQPLYIHQLQVGGQNSYNMAFVATENNSVYGIDTDAGAIIEQTSLNAGNGGTTETAVPYTDLPVDGKLGPCANIAPEVGITGTPVIDVSVTPPVLYVVSKHEDITSGVKSWVQKLHALDATTLLELPGSPVTIAAPTFNALVENQRAALALEPGQSGLAKVYIAWASHCDADIPAADFRGYVMEYQYNYATGTLSMLAVFNDETLKGATDGGIWMGGGGPVIDSEDNVYVPTGNGSFSSAKPGAYGNSVVKLNSSLSVQDYYTPPDWQQLNTGGTVSCGTPCQPACGSQCQVKLPQGDYDLAGGGMVLMTPSFALNNPELLAAGKQGMMYVIYTNSPMGELDAGNKNPTTVACTTATHPAAGAIAQCFEGMSLPDPFTEASGAGSRSTPIFWAGNNAENYLYTVGSADSLRAFQMVNNAGVGTFPNYLTPATSTATFSYPGATPSLTSNSTGNDADAIVWVVNTAGAGVIGKNGKAAAARPAVLIAYTAIPNGSSMTELWDSQTSEQTGPGAVKFVPPTVVDGKILIGGGIPGYIPGGANCPVVPLPTACGQLTVYGP
jgi:hypothetical protein